MKIKSGGGGRQGTSIFAAGRSLGTYQPYLSPPRGGGGPTEPSVPLCGGTVLTSPDLELSQEVVVDTYHSFQQMKGVRRDPLILQEGPPPTDGSHFLLPLRRYAVSCPLAPLASAACSQQLLPSVFGVPPFASVLGPRVSPSFSKRGLHPPPHLSMSHGGLSCCLRLVRASPHRRNSRQSWPGFRVHVVLTPFPRRLSLMRGSL